MAVLAPPSAVEVPESAVLSAGSGSGTVRRSYVYKAALRRREREGADRVLRLSRELYNAALEERREAWRRCRLSVGRVAQQAQLPEIKQLRPEFAELDAQMLQGVLDRLDRAFQGFFRRVRQGQTPGYPRFQGRGRFDSVTFKQTGWKLGPLSASGRKRTLTLRGIGTFRLFWSRELTGRVKTVTLKRDAVGDWFVVFSCDGVPIAPLPPTGRRGGVDLGLGHFLATSDGDLVPNPRPLASDLAALRRSHRRASRRRKGGHRRRKAVRLLARAHRRVARVRRDHHFKTALWLVRQYDLIGIEQLNVQGLARSVLARSVADAGWGQFIGILLAKAVSAGRVVVSVDPRGTSQRCSECGAHPLTPKALSHRQHHCP